MKRITIWMLGVGLLYYFAGVSLPYILALKRGGTVVSTSGWYGDGIVRGACVNGGHLVYPNRSLARGLEFDMIDKNGNKFSVVLEITNNYSWCLNQTGEAVAIATWDDWWFIGEDIKRPVSIMTYAEGDCSTYIIELPEGPYSLDITDIDDGWFLAHITQLVDDRLDGAMFIHPLQGDDPLIPIGIGAHIKSGMFWSDGFVYRDKDHVTFHGSDGYKHILGEINDGMMAAKNHNSVAWTSRGPESHIVVRGYSRDVGSWEQKGFHPFLTDDDKLIVVDNELGGIAVASVLREERKLLVRTEKARYPAYFNGKIYWVEETLNLSFPIQFLLHELLGGEAPQLEQTHLFTKVVDF